MEIIKLIGVLIVVIGFILKLDTLALVVVDDSSFRYL